MIGDRRVTRNPVKSELATAAAKRAIDWLGSDATAVTFPGNYVEEHCRELKAFNSVHMYELCPKTFANVLTSNFSDQVKGIWHRNLYREPTFQGPVYHDLDGTCHIAKMAKFGCIDYLVRQNLNPARQYITVVFPERNAHTPTQLAQLEYIAVRAFGNRADPLQITKYGGTQPGTPFGIGMTHAQMIHVEIPIQGQ